MRAEQRMRLRAALFPAVARVRLQMRPLRHQAEELAALVRSTDYRSIDLDDLTARVRHFHASVREFSDTALPAMDEALEDVRAILQEESPERAPCQAPSDSPMP